MSVNIYDGTNLIPIAGKTVPAPTPDYVDEQFNPSTTYSQGMTCIEGNVRYRYKNSTATSGHRPPNTTYWEVFSVTDELTWKTLTFTASDAIQNDVLKTANEIIVCNDAFGFVAHLVKELPNSSAGSPWNVIHENHYAMSRADNTNYFAGFGYYWDISGGYVRTRVFYLDYSGWTNASAYPTAILYR